MSAVDAPTCAWCGRGGDGLKTCTACKRVKYCNVTCQKAHRREHKEECRRGATEMDGESISEGFLEMYKDPPPTEDCPICFIPLSRDVKGTYENVYQSCCGKMLCAGCVTAADEEIDKGNLKTCCPFCREPLPSTHEEVVERCRKRMEANDAEAFYAMGAHYENGAGGLPQDIDKALEFFVRAGELGKPRGYFEVAAAYGNGDIVERDDEKNLHYIALGALGGDIASRHRLGLMVKCAGRGDNNEERAMKHFMIAARTGHDESLREVGEGYKRGRVTKSEYEKTLRAHKDSRDQERSEQRDKAAAMTSSTLTRVIPHSN